MADSEALAVLEALGLDPDEVLDLWVETWPAGSGLVPAGMSSGRVEVRMVGGEVRVFGRDELDEALTGSRPEPTTRIHDNPRSIPPVTCRACGGEHRPQAVEIGVPGRLPQFVAGVVECPAVQAHIAAIRDGAPIQSGHAVHGQVRDGVEYTSLECLVCHTRWTPESPLVEESCPVVRFVT